MTDTTAPDAFDPDSEGTVPDLAGSETVEIDIIEVDTIVVDAPARVVDGPARAVDGPNTYTEGDDTDPYVIPGTTSEDIANS